MFLADCHCDTLSELYKQKKSLYANDLMLDTERILRNGGGLQFMAMFIPTEIFRAGAGATYTLKLIDTYLRGLRELEQKGISVNRILSKEDLKQLPNGKFNTLLAIEEGGALDGSLELLRVCYELGVRCMTLVWSNRNDIADGVNEECSKGGLTMFGRQVVAEMNRLGMAVDVSHISTYGFWDVLEHSTKTFLYFFISVFICPITSSSVGLVRTWSGSIVPSQTRSSMERIFISEILVFKSQSHWFPSTPCREKSPVCSTVLPSASIKSI